MALIFRGTGLARVTAEATLLLDLLPRIGTETINGFAETPFGAFFYV
jgi:hypothetical protein